MELQQWLEEWLAVCIKNNVKMRTYNGYKSIMYKHILPYFKGVKLKELSYGKMLGLIATLKERGNTRSGKGLSQSSVNGVITLMRMSLEEAVACGYIEVNCCAKLKRAHNEEKKIKVLSLEQQKRLECYLKEQGKRQDIGILISLYTGLRIGELLALKWKDINFENDTISINKTLTHTTDYSGHYITFLQSPKTASSNRVIPMPTMLSEKLKEIRPPDGEEFVVSKNKNGYSIRGYQYAFERIIHQLEFSKLGFHSLRHTFATRCVECGCDLKSLSEILGHSSASITINRYVHSFLKQKQIVMNKLDDLYKKNHMLSN